MLSLLSALLLAATADASAPTLTPATAPETGPAPTPAVSENAGAEPKDSGSTPALRVASLASPATLTPPIAQGPRAMATLALTPPPLPPTVATPGLGEERRKQLRTHFGLVLDAGLPYGAAFGVTARPWHYLRFHGAGTFIGAGTGLRAGVSLVPFHSAITPSLSVEIGRWLYDRQLSVVAPTTLLRGLQADYVTGELGLELGAPNWFVFFLRGGVMYVHGTIPGFLPQLSANDPAARLDGDPLHVRGFLPTVRLGFLVYVY